MNGPFYKITVALLSFALIALLAGCVEDSDGPFSPIITGSLVAVSDCGGFPTLDLVPGLPTNQSAISWYYDGEGTLELYHLNAAFNCCPAISCRISYVGSTITVQEMDRGMCDCVCLTDALYHVTGLSPGTHNIKFEEMYLEDGDEPLEFSITLGTDPASGSYSVYRDHYPWFTPVPSGGVVNFSECGGFDSPRFSTEPPADSNCFAWEFDDNRLRIRHTNAMFNCCIDMLVVTIRVAPDAISITEDQVSPSPCYCDCPYDIDMEIIDLPPGVYRMKVVNAYQDQLIEFTLDLITQPNGYYCYGADMTP